MAQLIVRNLEEEVVQALRLRAVQHGRSAEAEHRELLRQALLPRRGTRSLKEVLLAMPPLGEDADFERVPDLGREQHRIVIRPPTNPSVSPTQTSALA